MRRRIALAAASIGVIIGCAACDPMPVLIFRNERAAPVILDFEGGEVDYFDPLPVKPKRESRFIASGTVFEDQLRIVTNGCAYLYPVLPKGIGDGWGRVTRVRLGENMRLHLQGEGSFLDFRISRTEQVRPGWPVAPVSKTCR